MANNYTSNTQGMTNIADWLAELAKSAGKETISGYKIPYSKYDTSEINPNDYVGTPEVDKLLGLETTPNIPELPIKQDVTSKLDLNRPGIDISSLENKPIPIIKKQIGLGKTQKNTNNIPEQKIEEIKKPEGPTQDQLDQEAINEARNNSALIDFTGKLQNAFEKISASLARVTPDKTAGEGSIKTAQELQRNVLDDIARRKENEKEKIANSVNDPNSTFSKLYKNQLTKQFGRNLSPEVLKSLPEMTAAQAKGLYDMLSEQRKIDVDLQKNREDNAFKREMLNAEYNRKNQELKTTEAEDKMDAQMAKVLSNWETKGRVGLESNIQKLKEARKLLENPDFLATGRFASLTEGTPLENKQARYISQLMNTATLDALQSLKGATSDKDLEFAKRNAFDPMVGKDNIKKIDYIINTLQGEAENNDKYSKLYNTFGTTSERAIKNKYGNNAINSFLKEETPNNRLNITKDQLTGKNLDIFNKGKEKNPNASDEEILQLMKIKGLI